MPMQELLIEKFSGIKAFPVQEESHRTPDATVIMPDNEEV
jgi:hypothetical protein